MDDRDYAEQLIEHLVEGHGSPGEAYKALEKQIKQLRMMQVVIIMENEPIVVNGTAVDFETVEKAVGIKKEVQSDE